MSVHDHGNEIAGNTAVPRKLYIYVVTLFFITLCLRIVLTTYYNSNYGGIEQNVVYGIQRILLSQPLYQDPSAGTYAVMQYSPLFYYFAAFVAKATHITALNVQGIYTLCRLLALLFNLLTVSTVALILRSWRFSWTTSFVFAMPVLIVLTMHYYTRVDSMHLFFFTAAFYALIRFIKGGGLLHIITAALFSAACIMTKQSGILIFGITCFMMVFTERKYLAALLYTLLTIAIAYFIALPCINNSWQAFYQNAYLGLKNGIDLSFLPAMFISQFFLDMVPCYFLGGIMLWLAVKQVQDKTFRTVAIAGALSFLFAVVTGLKTASSNNYFTEFLVFVIITIPYLLQSEDSSKILFKSFGYTVTIKRFTYIAFIILITSKTIGLFSAVCIEKSLKNNKAEYAREQQLYQYFHQPLGIKANDHVFFTDRLFLDNLFIEHDLIPTKDVVAQVYATDHNTYNYSHFIKGMNSGLIKYIVTTDNKKDLNEWNRTIPFIHFDKTRFKLLANYLGYTIYVYVPGN